MKKETFLTEQVRAFKKLTNASLIETINLAWEAGSKQKATEFGLDRTHWLLEGRRQELERLTRLIPKKRTSQQLWDDGWNAAVDKITERFAKITAKAKPQLSG